MAEGRGENTYYPQQYGKILSWDWKLRSNAWRMGVQGNQEAKYEMKMFLGAFDM